MNADVCYLNREALFCAETEDYRIPAEPDADQEVTLRFRTGREDVDRIIYRECGRDLGQEMVKAASDTYFDYYEGRIKTGKEQIRYYFEIKKGSGTCI